jgi:hypothetical protein
MMRLLGSPTKSGAKLSTSGGEISPKARVSKQNFETGVITCANLSGFGSYWPIIGHLFTTANSDLKKRRLYKGQRPNPSDPSTRDAQKHL